MNESQASTITININGQAVAIQKEFPIRVSCMEHAELAIDDYVDEYEVAPDTYRRADVDDESVPTQCERCQGQGEIVLLKEKGL